MYTRQNIFPGRGWPVHLSAVSGASKHRDSSSAQNGTASQNARSCIVEIIILTLLQSWPLPPILAYDRQPCRSFWVWATWWEPFDNSVPTERVKETARAFFESFHRFEEVDRLWQSTRTRIQLQLWKRKWLGDEVVEINSIESTETCDECEERCATSRWEAILISRQQDCDSLEVDVQSRSAIFSIISFDPLSIMPFDHQLYHQTSQQGGTDGLDREKPKALVNIVEESQDTLPLRERSSISAMEGEDKICKDRIRGDINFEKDPRPYELEEPANRLDMEIEREPQPWSSKFSSKPFTALGEKTVRVGKDIATFHMGELDAEDCHMELEELLGGFGEISGLSKGPHTESLWAATISDSDSTQDWASKRSFDCVRCHELKADSKPWKTDLHPIRIDESPLTVFTSQVQPFLLNEPTLTVFASFPQSPPITPQWDSGYGSNWDWEREDMGKEESSCEKQSKRKIEFASPAEEQTSHSKRLKTVDLTHPSEIVSVVRTDTTPLQPITEPNMATRQNGFRQPLQTKPPIRLQGAFEGFVRLPQELQDEIWQVAVAQIDTHISVKITTPGGKAGDIKLKCRNPNLHALYSTCTVARYWFLQRFELTGELMSCKLRGKLGDEEHDRIIRFDPNKEEILFSGSFQNHRYKRCSGSKRSNIVKKFKSVKRVAFAAHDAVSMSTFLGSPNPAFSYFEALERVEYIIIRKSPRTWRIDRKVNNLYDDPGAYEYRTLYSDIYTEGREYEIQAIEREWNYAYRQWLSILTSRNMQKIWMHRLIPMLATPKEKKH